MKGFDKFCAGALFVSAITECLMVPRNYTGRIWIFGTGLALLFTAMLNWLRVRNPSGVTGLRLSSVVANVAMLAFGVGLMASIGRSRTFRHPYILALTVVLFVESAFSLGKKS
jgi:hypothetical protein